MYKDIRKKAGMNVVYRLLGINLDGALLNSKSKLDKNTKEALQYVTKKGVEIALFTSKSYQYAEKIGRAIKCNPHIIAHRGAYIVEKMDRPIFVKRIPEDVTQDITRFLEGMGCHVRLIHEKMTVANRVNLPNEMFARIKWSPGDSKLYTQQFVDSLVDYLQDQPLAPPAIDVYFQNETERADARAGLLAIFDQIAIHEVEDEKMVLLPAGVNKATALSYLSHYIDITPEEMVIVGCEADDIDLMEKVGLGVTISNAPQSVKNVADWVTRTNDEQGLSYMVKEVFRRQHPIHLSEKLNSTKK